MAGGEFDRDVRAMHVSSRVQQVALLSDVLFLLGGSHEDWSFGVYSIMAQGR